MRYDPFLTCEQDALDQTYSLEDPDQTVSAGDAFGVGGLTPGTVTRFILRGCEIPQAITTKRGDGPPATTQPRQLLLRDDAGRVTPACRVRVQGVVYRIANIVPPDAGDVLIKVTLQEES